MSACFVTIDHDSPPLVRPDLRDWVAADQMVHFILDAVKALDLILARTNQRGTGHAQCPPSMMLGLLIDCYATDTFSSRRISPRLRGRSGLLWMVGVRTQGRDHVEVLRAVWAGIRMSGAGQKSEPSSE